MALPENIMAQLGGQQGTAGGLASFTTMLSENGGLQGLMAKMTGSGAGPEVQSWVGSGQNMPVSGDKVQQALEPDSLNKIARTAGTTPEKISEQVAQILPEVVDKATPEGQVPKQGEDPLTKGIDAIKSMFAKR
ncbi:MAG: YidB family protein [Streptosporangiaceae bacterium]